MKNPWGDMLSFLLSNWCGLTLLAGHFGVIACKLLQYHSRQFLYQTLG